MYLNTLFFKKPQLAFPHGNSFVRKQGKYTAVAFQLLFLVLSCWLIISLRLNELIMPISELFDKQEPLSVDDN